MPSTGILVAKMKDTHGDVWRVSLTTHGLNHPLVCISTDSSPKHTYHASVFVGLGGRAGFCISPADNEPAIEFSHDQWLPACIAVRNAIPGTCGELDVRWVPNDPSVPF